MLIVEQRRSLDGVVTCGRCNHQALHHDNENGCRFCDCARTGDSFDYTEPRMESPDPMLQFFQFAHLPPHLQVASKPFCDLAVLITDTFPRNPERTVALRKLLEAKDCAVRALIYKP